MAAPSMVFTARYTAKHLGVDLDVIEELAEEMAPEDGRLSVIDSLDDDAEAAIAFTRRGLDYLDCGSAWKRDPGSGVIGVEKGPLIPVV
ncbi:MAG: hypothetical protein ACJA1G_002328 [Qipengyuania sp.]|jgi:hypothetical protein